MQKPRIQPADLLLDLGHPKKKRQSANRVQFCPHLVFAVLAVRQVRKEKVQGDLPVVLRIRKEKCNLQNID